MNNPPTAVGGIPDFPPELGSGWPLASDVLEVPAFCMGEVVYRTPKGSLSDQPTRYREVVLTP